jgi:hypothetical protein
MDAKVEFFLLLAKAFPGKGIKKEKSEKTRFFSGVLPPGPFSGNSSPDLFFGALPRALHGGSPVASFGATAPDPVLGALPPMPPSYFFLFAKKEKSTKKEIRRLHEFC